MAHANTGIIVLLVALNIAYKMKGKEVWRLIGTEIYIVL